VPTITISGFCSSSISRKSLYFFGIPPVSCSISVAALSKALRSTSHRATASDWPAASAVRRMFMPHQPLPIRAVRYFLFLSAPWMDGAAKATLAAALVFRKLRRFTLMINLPEKRQEHAYS
jgi:hypothetical protein